jgi:hypothetical protein
MAFQEKIAPYYSNIVHKLTEPRKPNAGLMTRLFVQMSPKSVDFFHVLGNRHKELVTNFSKMVYYMYAPNTPLDPGEKAHRPPKGGLFLFYMYDQTL